jgi:hypothetical protein
MAPDYTINATLALDGVSADITEQAGQASADIPLRNYKVHQVIVRATTAAASTATLTFGAGGADGLRSAIGVVTGTVAQNEVKYFGPFEASRVCDATGDLLLTVTGGGVTPADVKLEIVHLNS